MWSIDSRLKDFAGMAGRHRGHGWTFHFDPSAKFVWASHPDGGKHSVAEVRSCGIWGDEVGYALAELLNGRTPLGAAKPNMQDPQGENHG